MDDDSGGTGLRLLSRRIFIAHKLHEHPEDEAGEEGDQTVDGLCEEEGAAALGEEGDGGVTVLGDAACDKDREWHDAGGVEGYEDKMRTGLGNYADKGCEQDHQDHIVAYPVLYINELQAYAEYKEDTEGPSENRREMLADNVSP